VARRRGFVAELQYQNQLAERQRVQAERAQARAYAAAVREAERAQRQAERAAAQAARASAARAKEAEREAKRLHEAARLAEAEVLNSHLSEVADELDSILAATLEVDDYVDLETLRVKASLLPFPRNDLEVPAPDVVPLEVPPAPAFVEPEAPTGLSGMFGGKKRHAAAVAQARAAFDDEYAQWQEHAAAVPAQQLEQMRKRDATEQQRLQALAAARAEYDRGCEAREADAARSNAQLDALISGLQRGEHAAVQEYIGIVLGNSVYPSVLSVEHDYDFDPETRELALTVLVCAPDRLPSEKSFRWVKSKDEIVATALAKKDLKERYASIVHQVALRTVHEVFEADRAGQVQTITLQVATETRDPATGLPRRIPFVGMAAERDSFMAFDLHNVVPSATLAHLGAAMSKSPYDLVAIDEAPGVRGR
jgi:restriction system protein